MTDRPLTVVEAAEWLGVSESWLRHECAARRVPFTKVARQLRFTEEHLRQILAAGEQRPVTAPTPLIRAPRRRTAA